MFLKIFKIASLAIFIILEVLVAGDNIALAANSNLRSYQNNNIKLVDAIIIIQCIDNKKCVDPAVENISSYSNCVPNMCPPSGGNVMCCDKPGYTSPTECQFACKERSLCVAPESIYPGNCINTGDVCCGPLNAPDTPKGGNASTGDDTPNNGGGGEAGATPSGGTSVDLTVLNPLGPDIEGISGTRTVIGRVINGILGITGSFGLFMFIYGGFIMLTSAGNTEKISKGKNILIWAIIGILVIMSSYAIVRFILGAIT